MDEIWALQQELERAQAAEIVQRLSERNCVEIVLKLIESDRLKLIFSSTGKEFLTPRQLRREILSEVQSHGGRMSITDLPDLLNVDLANIERATNDVTSGSGMSLVNGQLISKANIDAMCSEVAESVLDTGMVTLAALSQQFALPIGLIESELNSRLNLLGQKFNCQLYLQNQKLYTDLYAKTHNAKIRGLLLGSTRPVSLQSLISTYGLQEKMVKNWAQEMDNSLPGAVSGGSNALGTFTPWVYLRAQKEYVSALYTECNFIEVSKLQGAGLAKPTQYFSELFPDSVHLQRIFIHPTLIQSVESAIADISSSDSWLDVRTLLPQSLSTDDVASVIKKAEESTTLKKASRQYQHLEKVFVVSNAFIKSCITSLETLVTELGTQAAIAMHQKSKQPVPIVDDDVDGKGSKSKKDRGKKRSTGNNDALSRLRPSLDLDLIKETLTCSFPDCDPILIGGIVSQITPTLRSQFEKVRDSPHIINDGSQSDVDVSEIRRKQIKHWIQHIQNLAEHFQAFSAANNELSGLIEDIVPIEQYLIKTTGQELSDALLRLNVYLCTRDYADDDKSTLNEEKRAQLLEMLPPGTSKSILALSSHKNSTDFFTQFKMLAASADVQLKDLPKKKLKQMAFSMKTRLAQQILAEQRPEAVLLSAIILLFSRITGLILHAPFTLVDQLLEGLYKSKIATEAIDQVKALKEEIANPTDRLHSLVETVRAIVASEPKSQDSNS